MKHFEDFEEDEQPDQTTTGWEPTPLPSDHFSLSPEWKRYKASLIEPVSENALETPTDWRGFAYALCGQTEPDEEML